MNKEWSDLDKAQWILENGPVPDIVWIYERVGDKIYKRPFADPNMPPWINTRREEVVNYTAAGFELQDFYINEEHTEGKKI